MPKDTYTRAEILSAIALEPCHVTGDHDPSHTPQYVCDIQRSEQIKRLLVLLETDESDLPRRLHRRCTWCRLAAQAYTELEHWALRPGAPAANTKE